MLPKGKLILVLLLITGFSLSAQARRNFIQRGPAVVDINAVSLLAAHSFLPAGAQVRITNTENGKQIIAVISGRIDDSEDRIAVLSTGAAALLEMPLKGTTQILIETISPIRDPGFYRGGPPSGQMQPLTENPAEDAENVKNEPVSINVYLIVNNPARGQEVFEILEKAGLSPVYEHSRSGRDRIIFNSTEGAYLAKLMTQLGIEEFFLEEFFVQEE